MSRRVPSAKKPTKIPKGFELDQSAEKQSEVPIPKKWIFLGLGMLAAIPAGNFLENIDRNRNVTPTSQQSHEITTRHTRVLEELGSLPLDDSGKFRGKAVFSSSASSSLELSLHLDRDSDSLVVQSSGQHSGLSKTRQDPYSDPFNFRLTYSVANMNVTSPGEALQKLRQTPEHMPEELSFKSSKTRITLLRGDPTTKTIDSHVDFTLGEDGTLQTIRVGDTPLQGDEVVVNNAVATLDLIEHEINLATTY